MRYYDQLIEAVWNSPLVANRERVTESLRVIRSFQPGLRWNFCVLTLVVSIVVLWSWMSVNQGDNAFPLAIVVMSSGLLGWVIASWIGLAVDVVYLHYFSGLTKVAKKVYSFQGKPFHPNKLSGTDILEAVQQSSKTSHLPS